ncbi:hypothetical protein K2173_014239 [Erythroxylum novogranatense]|uniref:GRAM domain-containing protein n=1 Tax=Erythroxylum novogranatense TaxID=1862640 RepID=A0AAV8SDW6_9ROSI|nr:hypothetical protein K2173_014239 [Erythroxylum novogranatense]
MKDLEVADHSLTPERDRNSSASLSEQIWFSPSSSDASSPIFNTAATTRRPECDGDRKIGHLKKMKNKGTTLAFRFRDHVRMGTKLSETVKGKVKLGAKIIKEGGRHNIFKHTFGVVEGEELLKASQCYLSTTTGPIAGLLFISTHKLAFCSQRYVSFPSPDNGQFLRFPYKVVIPISKIKRACQSENVDKPEQKYIQIVTEDNFEFWFMGFLRYEKAFKNLEKAISLTHSVSSI